MNIYRLRDCRKCGGDLARDDGDWICLQCGSYSYVGLYLRVRPPTNRLSDPPADSGSGRAPSGPSKHVGVRVATVAGLNFASRPVVGDTAPLLAAFR